MVTISILPGTLLLLTLLTGFWLYKTGRPLNIPINTIHKLSAVAAVILTGRIVVSHLQSGKTMIMEAIPVTIVAIGIILIFVSGAILSSSKPPKQAMKTIHRISTALIVISFITFQLLF